MLRVETDLLLRTAGADLVPGADVRIRELLAQRIEWPAMIAMSRLHGTAAPLVAALDRHADLVPSDAREELCGDVREMLAYNEELADKLLEVLARFQAAGIPMLPFKGPEGAVIAPALGERLFNDIDVFVALKDARASVELLAGMGYTMKAGRTWDESVIQWSHGETLKSDEGYEVDLHWDLLPVRVFGCKFHFDRLWHHRNVVPFRGQEISVLSREDLLLMLCIHGCKHRWLMVKWIRDVAVLSTLDPPVDWKALESRASRMGARRMMALSLYLVHDLLGVTPPETATNLFPPDRVVRSLARDVLSYIEAGMEYAPRGPRAHRFHLAVRERARDRMRYSIRLAKRLSDPTRWQVPLPAFFSLLFLLAWPFWALRKGAARLLSPGR